MQEVLISVKGQPQSCGVGDLVRERFVVGSGRKVGGGEAADAAEPGGRSRSKR